MKRLGLVFAALLWSQLSYAQGINNPCAFGTTAGTCAQGNDNRLQTATAPTQQTFLSGSGTYTTPAGVKWIKVTLLGGGSGGVGSGAGQGSPSTAGATTFGTGLLTANGALVCRL